MNHQQPSPRRPVADMIATSPFGTFFGVSQETFDRVWGQLTASEGTSIVYISMEIGADPDVFSPVRDCLENAPEPESGDERYGHFLDKFLNGPQKIPTYSGGLGVLAGDTLKSYADCHLPVLAISLLYRRG